ncbi:YfiR family protein [Enterobacteriaceae bacterium G50]|nr:YfiR family protein [Enterobacteriaceae bacterium G50]
MDAEIKALRRIPMSNPFLKLSYPLVLVLIFFTLSRPLLAAVLTDRDKSVRSMVSGIISYTRWPQPEQPPTLCIFSTARYRDALRAAEGPPVTYHPVLVHSRRDVLNAGCAAIYFGSESPEQQVELENMLNAKPTLFISEQNAECRIGSSFCLLFNTDKVTFAVNLDSLSRSGVRVNPDVLMLARNKNHE